MNDFNEIITAIVAVVTTLSGSGLFVAIKNLTAAAKVRADAKKISEDGHAETQRQLEALESKLSQFAALAEENAALRAIDAAKDRKIERLEKDLSNALSLKGEAKVRK